MTTSPSRPRRWGVYATTAYGVLCIAWDLVLMRDGVSAADLTFIATWQVIAYLAGCGVVWGVVPLVRRATSKLNRRDGGTV
jgi:hypothetical protein